VEAFKKWTMDLLKNALVLASGAAVTAFLLNRCEASRTVWKNRAEHVLSRMEQDAETFDNISKRYHAAAYDAYAERRGSASAGLPAIGHTGRATTGKPPNVALYEDDLIDQLRAARDKIQKRYSTLRSDVVAWDIASKTMHDCYKDDSCSWDTFEDRRHASKSAAKRVAENLLILHEECWQNFMEHPFEPLKKTCLEPTVAAH